VKLLPNNSVSGSSIKLESPAEQCPLPPNGLLSRVCRGMRWDLAVSKKPLGRLVPDTADANILRPETSQLADCISL
jgi:hypothetical protein